MQLNIFSNSKYTQLEKESRKLKKKRVHYKTPTYKKFYKNDIGSNITQNDTSNWGRMRQLHLTIANFFPIFFSNVEPSIIEEDYRVYDFGIVRVCKVIFLMQIL